MNSLREIGAFVGTPNASLRAVGSVVRFVTDDHTSMRGIIHALETVGSSVAQSIRPLYRRSIPGAHDARKIDSTTDHIDLSDVGVHLPPFDEPKAEVPYTVAEAARRFDARAAATVSAATGFANGVSVFPSGNPETGDKELLEQKLFDGAAPDIFIPTAKCLAALAYPDFFPDVHADRLRPMVSEAILAASSGWCGSFGPGVHDSLTFLAVHSEGNYDMSQMHLLHMAYAYYDELSEAAREHLITVLLAGGRVRRVNIDDIVTNGPVPNDWARAGFLDLGIVNVKRIGETENHILTIHTARYLTNQLLYQRDHHPDHDNRRNGSDDAPSCTELMLALLRNILRDDFSEYNAKNYQNEVREALLNLCNFAYDHEVRLGARMVLDYISARMAVSTSDLRRMVPFRRRNEGQHSSRTDKGYMDVGLLETNVGADPMAPHFAILAGNTRAYETRTPNRPKDWSISTAGSNGHVAVADALSEYRLPLSIHDLFVTDGHRRFYQRLHRGPQDDPEVTGRNCDNHEVYAGSPSYLISAGGSPADFAIDPRFLGIVAGDQDQQLGVAVTTSFMPTGASAGGPLNSSIDLIQFSSFSQEPGQAVNYGVAPDFACGHQVHLPDWCRAIIEADVVGKFAFISKRGPDGHPGFYLAFLRDGQLTAMEAFDTWLHPEVKFEAFKDSVLDRNRDLNINGLQSNVEADYTTHNGNRVTFVIWNELDGDDTKFGARVVRMTYGDGDPEDRLGDAGNPTDQFLRGTVMNSGADGVVEVTNHFLGTKLTLDMHDQAHPRRTDGNQVEEAGSNQEVWVNLAWKGPAEGDFFHPFNTMAAAVAAVAPGGVIKMMPGVAS